MLCLIAKLSEEATARLEAVRKAAGYDALKPLHGHITIATYMGEDEAAFIRFCREQLDGAAPFTVQYQKIEVLEETSVIVAVPEKTSMLEEIHRRVAEQYSNELDRWTKEDSWVPHTTLFFTPGAELREIYRKLLAAFAPFTARICGAEFSRVLDSGYEIVDRVLF